MGKASRRRKSDLPGFGAVWESTADVPWESERRRQMAERRSMDRGMDGEDGGEDGGRGGRDGAGTAAMS